MRFTYLSFLLLLALLLSSCTSPLVPGGTPPPGGVTDTPSPGEQPSATITPTPTEGIPFTPSGEVTLRIWVPPQFDTQGDTPAGNLLRQRLDEFVTQQTGVSVQVRVKALEGVGGLLDSLAAASAAAPEAVPDLIALPRPKLETAAIKGLLQPMDTLITVPSDEGWYDYARDLSRVENSTFGLPFAGDALVLVYRPAVTDTPTPDWATLLEVEGSIVFPAADPQSLVTLTLYEATGGVILDEQERPTLEVSPLTEVLTFYQQAQQAELIPEGFTERESDTETWEIYQDRQADMIITMISRYLRNPPVDSAAAPIPTMDGTPYTIATGWSWALASSDSERQVLSLQLAQFLTASDFLAEWTAAAGYLPTQPEVLAAWENVPLQALVSQIVTSAQLIPSTDVLATLGPVLQGATLEVLEGQTSPATAAQDAVERLVNP